MTVEVPDAVLGHSYYEGTVAAAIAQAAGADVLCSRRRGQGRRGLYGDDPPVRDRPGPAAGWLRPAPRKLTVTEISQGRQRTLVWEDAAGNRSEVPVSAVDTDQRRRLFINGPEGLEPLQLWLTEGGMPMRYDSWPKVFDAASARCARLGSRSR